MEAPEEASKGQRARRQRKKSSKPAQPRKTDVLDSIIAKMEKEIQKDGAKVSVGDYIRLRQFRDEQEAEGAKEIRVTWVEPNETESATET
jgi:hypothetical protein